MSDKDWQKYLETDEVKTHKKKKLNKNFVCKKNKLGGGRFGNHEYDKDGIACIKCGHLNKDKKGNYYE